jgi:hypothetical protein
LKEFTIALAMSSDSPSRAIRDKKMLHLPDWSLIDLPEHEVKVSCSRG